jgi:hypothetical protein
MSKKMDRLLQNPRADAPAVVAPAAGTLAIGGTEQADAGVQRLADLAVADQAVNEAPLTGQPQLVPDRQHLAAAPHGLDDAIAVGNGCCHRLLQQHVLASLEGRDGNVGVQMVGHDDVDGVDRGIGDHCAPIQMNAGLGMLLPRQGRACLAGTGDRP